MGAGLLFYWSEPVKRDRYTMSYTIYPTLPSPRRELAYIFGIAGAFHCENKKERGGGRGRPSRTHPGCDDNLVYFRLALVGSVVGPVAAPPKPKVTTKPTKTNA